MAILDDAKLALRISGGTTLYDGEIEDLIDAAREDLMACGVGKTPANDDSLPLVKRAILTYVKANFGWNNPDAERLRMAYDLQAIKLALTAQYRGDDDAV